MTTQQTIEQPKANGAIEKTRPATPLEQLKSGFEKWKPALAAVLPKHISPERVIKIALNVYMNNPSLQDCTPQSMIRATMQCAELGLDPSPLLGEAYFIPFENTVYVKDGNTAKPRKQLEVQLMPGYVGLTKLVKQTGEVSDVYAVVVDESEKTPVFDANGQLVSGFYVEQGTARRIRHIQNFEKRTGKPFAAYGVICFKDGTHHFEIMSKDQIENIRKRSKSYAAAPAKSPWTTDEEAMWKKTMIKQAIKTVPKSPEKPNLAHAVAADNAAEIGEAFRSELTESLDGETYIDPQLPQSRTDQLAAKVGVPHDADGVLIES